VKELSANEYIYFANPNSKLTRTNCAQRAKQSLSLLQNIQAQTKL